MKIIKKLSFVILAIVAWNCNNQTDPQKIIDKSIAASGGDKYLNAEIEFDFRNRHYRAKRKEGMFSYERIFKDSISTIHDVLNNKGFMRMVDSLTEILPDSMAAKYTWSVNSVLYFVLLPYGLNDPPVKKKFLGTTQLDNQPYYKIEVTFSPDGGGEGFKDIFNYWINQKTFEIDYFSYRYFTEGGGIRFRKGYNRQKINGIVFQDYINYKPKLENTPLDSLESLFKRGELEEVSKIELKNITVK